MQTPTNIFSRRTDRYSLETDCFPPQQSGLSFEDFRYSWGTVFGSSSWVAILDVSVALSRQVMSWTQGSQGSYLCLLVTNIRDLVRCNSYCTRLEFPAILSSSLGDPGPLFLRLTSLAGF